MKIAKVETFQVQAGWRPWMFLKITTDSGPVGWADCTEAHGSSPGLAATLRDLGGKLVGRDPMPIELIFEDLYRITRQSSGGLVQKALAAIENALLDIRAKELGVSVASLLGGPVRSRIPLYWSHCGTTRARNPEQCNVAPVRSLDDITALGQEAIARGFAGIKTNLLMFGGPKGPRVIAQGFHGGEGSFDRNVTNDIIAGTVQLAEAFRAGIGASADLIIDINMHFRADGVVRIAEALAGFNLAWLEVDFDDPHQLRHIRDKAPMPIGSCEKRQLMSGYKPFFDAGAVDVAIVDVRWTGVLQATRIASLARIHDINVAPHNHGSPLASLMAAHFCAAAANVRLMEYDVDDVPWRDDLITAPLNIVDGCLVLSNAPGWGADIDERKLEVFSN